MKNQGPIYSKDHFSRDTNCPKYSQCLKMTVALEWDSFSCKNCSKKIDKKLLWKAYGCSKKNSLLKVICKPDSFKNEIKNSL